MYDFVNECGIGYGGCHSHYQRQHSQHYQHYQDYQHLEDCGASSAHIFFISANLVIRCAVYPAIITGSNIDTDRRSHPNQRPW
ncbi:uncharacterized protein PG986_004685 [Apiospora aurea]|uniref:Uncharacterized protein n=1 Tax=Apiospora aurea TaxID=335848 RepID=A0ABR1QNN2_9PEZI